MGWAGRVLPPLHLAYLRFVWRTSRIEDDGLGWLSDLCDAHGGAVALVWHDEVPTVPWSYPSRGLRIHTLASRGHAGEIVTRVLEHSGCVVFRGGSSRGRSRRRAGVLREMVAHGRSQRPVLWGLTVDGSSGPARRLKRGALVLARESGVPVVLVRTSFGRALRLPSWDRALLPLPFGVIRQALRGPFPVPPEARTRAGMECFRRELEERLLALTREGERALARPRRIDRPAGAARRAAGARW